MVGHEVNFIKNASAKKGFIVGFRSGSGRSTVLDLKSTGPNLVGNEAIPLSLAHNVLLVLYHGIIDKILFTSSTTLQK